jgi:DNA-binding transcriptional MerR regulator
MATTYDMRTLAREVAVPARTIRHWIHERVLTAPLGKGRAARYDQRHLLRARVIAHMRGQRASLKQINKRIRDLSEVELKELLPKPAGSVGPDGVPLEPEEPSYPFYRWEVIELMDGLLLMVDPAKGAVYRKIAGDIFRHYGVRPVRR